ncbi:response regulator [Flavobacterium granuli]|uniref:Response regulator receiver domain-containing protein n=1 Tax=Flavobacterium granuli TaxID=280093 RepID=A0A1M5LJ10_9FLAO|nr:response regulator [Flavobacterium granuli]PRZ23996.1 response regulator receiver domain-containing protein [Flavobacterium granuli]SHG64946.1 Response regulator receiver domain-containing protein [Flavobacterium granuli]
MKNKKLYIIDDDKLSVKLMSMLIKKNQTCDEVHAFFNAQSALEELEKNSNDNDKLPDGILLDLNMPVMDGWQFLDEFILFPIKKEISIFIVTSSIDPVDIEMAKKHTFLKGYIMKPITAEKLKEMSKMI